LYHIRKRGSVLTIASSRPLRADARRNRERVLAAAREVFAEYGLDAQMDDVARAAGVGVGTVYRHFPTKEAVVEAVARGGYDDLCAIAHEALDEEDAWEAFSGFMWRGARLHRDDRAQCEIHSTRPDVVQRVAGDKRELLGMVAELIERGQKADVLRADLSSSDMPMLWCALGAAQQRSPDDAGWERYLTLMLDGLRAKPS
jgi:AcrR family transcriptional regulator